MSPPFISRKSDGGWLIDFTSVPVWRCALIGVLIGYCAGIVGVGFVVAVVALRAVF